jgi:hypothetical protein
MKNTALSVCMFTLGAVFAVGGSLVFAQEFYEENTERDFRFATSTLSIAEIEKVLIEEKNRDVLLDEIKTTNALLVKIYEKI